MIIKMPTMPGGKTGKVGKIGVKVGDQVAEGQILAQVETAKGNRPVKATADGTVAKILCEEGAEAKGGAELFDITEGAAAPQPEEAAPQAGGAAAEELATDLLIIGAGPGGYVAAIYAAKKGLKVTLVEKADLGGTCLNVGCIPTKALVKSSEICHHARNASVFGVEVSGGVTVNMAQVIARKDQVKDKLVSGVDYLMQKNRVQVLTGHAAFVDQNTVAVTGEQNYTVRARDIIIATGSKVSKPPIPGLELPFVHNSTTALADTQLPKSIAIIGGGVIGMEFACIYRNFGVEVHVIEFMDRILTMVDRDISEELQSIAAEAGIHIHTSSKVLRIQSSVEGQAVLTYEDKNGEHLLVAEKVLVAVGREPNLDGLELQRSGVALNDRGRAIQVDGAMATNVPHIYAIGDVTDRIQLAHVASHQGIVAVDNILGEKREMDYSAVPNVIFTTPEVASVGICEDEAKAKGMDVSTGRFLFEGNGKALTMNEPRGFIKVVRDNATQKIVGAAVIGPDASSLIATLTLAIANGLTEDKITETIFAHPTTGEVIHEAALDLGIGALHQ